jgi:hypothetical protein
MARVISIPMPVLLSAMPEHDAFGSAFMDLIVGRHGKLEFDVNQRAARFF